MSRRECRSTPCKGPHPIPRLRASLVRGTYQSAAGITYIFYPIGRLVNFIYSMLWNRLAQLFVASWRKRQRRRRWASVPGAHRPQKMRHREHSEAIHLAKALPKLDCRTRSRGFAMTTVRSFEVSKIFGPAFSAASGYRADTATDLDRIGVDGDGVGDCSAASPSCPPPASGRAAVARAELSAWAIRSARSARTALSAAA